MNATQWLAILLKTAKLSLVTVSITANIGIMQWELTLNGMISNVVTDAKIFMKQQWLLTLRKRINMINHTANACIYVWCLKKLIPDILLCFHSSKMSFLYLLTTILTWFDLYYNLIMILIIILMGLLQSLLCREIKTLCRDTCNMQYSSNL